MRGLKITGVFAAGLICGLALQFGPPNSAIADGRGGGSSGGTGGIANVNCPADIAPAPNGNGVVDIDDLVAVITHWGACPVPCDSSGTWVNAVAPSYQCGGGLVFFDISGWTFTQSGSTLTVMVSNANLLEQMTGTITDCGSGGTFTVSKAFPAPCTVTYTLTGTFSSPTQFTGTFSVTFTGFNCQTCTNHTFNISATKQ